MKKKLFLAAFIFVFLGIKAQITSSEYQSEALTEQTISQILENSRKKGIQAFEVQIQNDKLHKTMQQQQSGSHSNQSQRGSTPPHVNSSGCVNPGFEDGTINGWTIEGGDNSGATNLPCPTCFSTSSPVVDQVVNVTSNATVNNPAANCSIGNTPPCTNGIDNYGGFSVIPPGGGTYSLLLSNSCAGYVMQEAEYTFVVNSTTDIFIFNYAAVLQNGNHPPNESPYFNVSTTDLNTGAQPPCAQYNAVATTGSLNGLTLSNTSAASGAGGGVYYIPWTTVSLDLQTAVGHTVTVKFTVSDCNQGGHFGYCYIDAQCTNPTSASGVVGICGTTSGNLTLTAPPGYTTYQWYGPSPNLNTPIAGATSQTLTTAAAVGDTFAVKSTSAAGCVSTFNIVVQGSVINAVTTSTATCKGAGNGAVAISTLGSGTYQFAWTAPGGAAMGTNTSTSFSNLQPGTYSVSIIDNVAHCPTKDTTITVVGINPTLQTSTAQLCGTQTTLFAPTAFTGTPYQWYDNTNTITSTTTHTYNVTGGANGQHYTVTYLDSASHCEDSLQISLNQININFTPLISNPCLGGNNGSLTYNASSGNSFSTYDWAVTGGVTNSGTNVAAPITVGSALAAGTYSIIITAPGNASCSYTNVATLVNSGTPSVSTNTASVCTLDNLSINPGVPNVTHSWSGTGLTAGANTSVPLVISSAFTNTVVGFYTYTDTMRTVPDGCLSIYKEVVALKSFKATITTLEKIVCYHDSIGKLKTTVSQEINGPISTPDKYTFDWEPVAHTSTATGVPSTSILSNLKAGTYYCIVKNGNCIDTAKAVTLLDGLQLTGDSIYAYFCPKDSLVLMIADTNNNTNIKWHPDRLVQHDTIRVSVTGDSATVINAYLQYCYVTYKHNGCADTSKAIISVNTYDAFRPNELVNVFSPNGDKTNDFFFPFYQANMNQYQIWKQSDAYEIHIYDRWGKSVYDATDYSKPWDGKTKSGHDADNGSYFFIVKYKSNCGSNADVVEKKGFVELVR